jgi:molybdopterin molybdotransferase
MKHFIRKQGENLTKGQVALKAGTFLTPSRIGLCATMGHNSIPVVKRLRVAIISTGDELKQPGDKLERGEIYESNSFGLAGLVKWLGHHPVRMHCVGDTLDSLRESLNTAAEDCDLILTSGGVSMGEWDLVRKIMEDEGDVHFWRVKLRPGSPPLFGLWKDTPIFGLPGNPVSSHVVFRILVGPWIRNATSATGPIEVRAFAKLATTVKPTKDSLTLRRVTIETTEEGLVAHQKIHQGSGNLASIAYSEGMAVLQPEREYSIAWRRVAARSYWSHHLRRDARHTQSRRRLPYRSRCVPPSGNGVWKYIYESP